MDLMLDSSLACDKHNAAIVRLFLTQETRGQCPRGKRNDNHR